MKAVKIISIINQGGEYSIIATYNEVNENGEIVQKNTKAPAFYAVGSVLDNVKNIETEVKNRIGE